MARSSFTLACLALFLGACVKRAPDGSVLRALPHCDHQGAAVRARPLEDAVSSCMRLLTQEPVDSSRTLLGLTTDDQGRITEVCLVGSTHEPDSRYLNCLAEQLLRAPSLLPPNKQALVWTLNVSY